MDKKFLILLFATVFYNGVSDSTPIDGQQISDVSLPEEKPPVVSSPTAAVDPKKTDPALSTSTPISHNVSSLPQHVEATNEKNATIHQEIKNNTADVHNVDIKTPTQDANKINTQVSDNKNKTQIPDSKNMKNDTKNTNKPADDKHVTEVVPIGTNPSAKPVTTPPDQSTSMASTPTAAGPTTTTTVKPITTTSTVTNGPTSTSKSIAEQNTPAPAQEKHFDGPSFIGGIVLTIGLTAIGFIAFKYYKSGKIDMNYRTL